MALLSFLSRKPGRLFDIWSVPHFLFGVVAAMIAAVFSFPFFETLLIVLALAVAWEFIETAFGISEYGWNMLTDIVLPLAAFIVTTLLVDRADIDRDHRVALLVISVMVYVFTNVIAWQARLNGDREFFN
jgi:hypothetical protein